MKKKKIFIISYNNLPIDFWKAHLDYKNVELWLWKSPKHAINNLPIIYPDIVIIDGYWAKKSILPCLIKVLNKKFISNVFCISPKEESDARVISIDQRLSLSNFNNEVLKKINKLIKPSKKINQIISRTA
ncbi:MAG: hypothetical protein JKY30_09510 [Flavobacteriales bacterium]|nr:hypothetical protein [Flavobacteriales bacterium]